MATGYENLYSPSLVVIHKYTMWN